MITLSVCLMPDRAAPRLKFTGTVMQCAKWKILISTHKTKLGSAALLARFRLARCGSNYIGDY
jgi:hypothetical protein